MESTTTYCVRRCRRNGSETLIVRNLGSLAEAIEAYQKSITCDPGNADAHYNVARLLEQTGRPEMAIRHLLIYRQLTRRK